MRRTRLSLAALLMASSAVLALPAAASAEVAAAAAAVVPDVPVQLMTFNDFHGRINQPGGNDGKATLPGADGAYGTADDESIAVGGAASLAAHVARTREQFVTDGGSADGSLLIGLGDLVGASPFESAAVRDESTLEVMNALGVAVSVVGNHEFDRGTDELRRISGVTDGVSTDDVTACEGVEVGVTGCFTDSTGEPFAGTDFPYLAANVVDKGTREPILPPYAVVEAGGGRSIAFVGVVTDSTPTIVSPTGIADVDFLDEAESINRYVPELQAQGVEAIVALVHEGGDNTGEDGADPNGCDELTGSVVDINAATDAAVDLIVSAHSHQGYNCMLTDPAGQPRLVTQAEYYGRMITDVRLVLDGETGDVDRLCADYRAQSTYNVRDAEDAGIAGIVEHWTDLAAEEGDRVVGSATEAIARPGGLVDTDNDPSTPPVFRDDRTAESGLGNLVAQAQLESVQGDPAYGDPVIAFMNPGGLRADIEAGDVTYADLFNVQPFSNTVNTTTLTGADVRGVLEQQFQQVSPGATTGNGPRNSTLRLGTSEGLSYRYDLSKPYGQRIDPTSITVLGQPLDLTAEYRVAANSFIIGGGDGFTAFTNGDERGIGPVSGPVDVDSAVAYFETNSPVPEPAADHGQAATFDAPPPAEGLDQAVDPVDPVGSVPGTSGALGVAGAGFECPVPTPPGGEVPPPGGQVPPPVDQPGPPPVEQPGPPVHQPAPPVHQPAPPVHQPAPPVVHPVTQPRPTTGGGDQLAYTGAPVGSMLGVGGALLAGGVALTAAGYRRRRGLAD
ncbi:bifunctional metallophosphatase/5'-nucleotidase [Modestobacter sp. VKM Ac-2986]|uniref:bifunctional metallophosphatase/5'-nucleotidase n=1 Tax=Modestobacter sp. VKM Ac-2986 TaxID=3004140 RepID=UPI0022ABBB62|nr:bifunctional metallophosphatase/5'-nucleotidase [Modestobacter sp. VKM Ac-2986]MCZ2829534.1 bifunctional metallophosphatase/5'-nucleotidase [Modestobacter sp. VKM Ac-2986]